MIKYSLLCLILCSLNNNFNKEKDFENDYRNEIKQCIDYVNIDSEKEKSEIRRDNSNTVSSELHAEGNSRFLHKFSIEYLLQDDNNSTKQSVEKRTFSNFLSEKEKASEINPDGPESGSKRFRNDSSSVSNDTDLIDRNSVPEFNVNSSDYKKKLLELSIINNEELPSSYYNIPNRLSLPNTSSFNKTLSVSNVSDVNTLKSQQSKSNQFKWENIYYGIIKKVNCHNYKFYEKEINIYFQKLEECLNCYLNGIYKSYGNDSEYKVDWNKNKNIREIFSNYKTSPFKYQYTDLGTYITVLNKFKDDHKSNLEECEKLVMMKFGDIYEEINDFLVCFKKFIMNNEDCLENRKKFLKVISKIRNIRYNKYLSISEYEYGYFLYTLESFISNFDNEIKNNENYNYYFPEIREFLKLYNEKKKYFKYRPLTFPGKYLMLKLIREVTFIFVEINSERIGLRREDNLILNIRLMIYEMYRIFDFNYIYLLGYIIEILESHYTNQNDMIDLAIRFHKIFNLSSIVLFRSLCFKNVSIPDIYFEFNTNINLHNN